jgi:large exoprotein involved in heme utilization and adhesion
LGSGAGGDITLQAREIQLSNGGSVSAESTGAGDAGSIDVEAKDTFLSRDSSVTTEAKEADGGNIKLDAPYIVHLIDSEITASVGGGPETVGGNITMDPEYVVLSGSDIIANAYEGKGGNIRITAETFMADPESVVSASSELGIDGTVDIRSPIIDLSGFIAPLPEEFLGAADLLRQLCAARMQEGKYSSFVVKGRDGLPVEPYNLLPSPIYFEEEREEDDGPSL